MSDDNKWPADGVASPYARRVDADAVHTEPAAADTPEAPTEVLGAAPATPTEVLSPAAATPTKVLGSARETPTARLGTDPQVVYVERPTPPKVLSNRPIGVLVAVLSGLVFAVLAAFTALAVLRIRTGTAVLRDLENPGYWLPVILFFVAFLAAVLLLNRAGLWAHIIASVVVGAIVYLGTAFFVTLIEVYGLQHSGVTVGDALASPVTIVCGLVGREIALWAGALLGRRGRTLAARNSAARADYERALAEARAA